MGGRNSQGGSEGLAAEAAAVDNVASAPIPADVTSTDVAWANPIRARIGRQDPGAVHKHIARAGARRRSGHHYRRGRDRDAESDANSKTDTSEHRAARHQ